MASASGIFRVGRCAFLWPLVLLVLVTRSHADETNGDETETFDYLNVYGESLQPCSQDGMALTGYTRTGYCVDRSNDQGSHHVCIDLSSLGGGNENDGNGNRNEASSQNFCTVTGQSDWCSGQDMPCHADPSDYSCPVEDWCVCQWAFSSYVKASGCDNIQTVVCESVNRQALLAYQSEASKWGADPKYQTALDCLVEKCGLDASLYYAAPLTTTGNLLRGLWVIGLMVLMLVAAVIKQKQRSFRQRQFGQKRAMGENPGDKDGIVLGASVPSGSRLLGSEKTMPSNTAPPLAL